MIISGCVIAKNEEKHIKTCIESMKKVANEIIFVDTGSTDRTVDIASSLGVKKFYYRWDNNFSNARNYALSKAKGDWILFLDADEYLTSKSIDFISSVLKKYEINNYDCILVLMMNMDKGSGKFIGSIPSVRLFRNDKRIQYRGAVHETVVKIGGKLNMLDATDRIQVIHTGYNPDIIKEKNKGERNVALLLEELKKKPNDSNICYYLSESYEIAGNFEKALEYAYKALEYNNGNLLSLYQKNYYNIIKLMGKLDYPAEEIRNKAIEAVKKYPDYPDLHFMLARANVKDNRLHDTAEAIENGIKNIGNAKFAQAGAHFQIKEAMLDLGNIYYKLNRLQDSVKAYIESLKSDKYYFSALKGLMHVLIRYENSENILAFLQKIYDFSNLKDLLHIFMASIKESEAYIAGRTLGMVGPEHHDALLRERAFLHIINGNYSEAISLLKKGENRAVDGIYNEICTGNEENEDMLKGNEGDECEPSRKKEKEKDIEILYALSLLLSENLKDYFEDDEYLGLISDDSLRSILNRLTVPGNQLVPEDKAKACVLIEKSIQAGKPDLVEKILSKLLELNLYYEAAELFYLYECYEIAAGYYSKFAESREEIDDVVAADMLVKMGCCMYKMCQYELAVQFFRDAAKIDARDYRIYEYGIMACEQCNDGEMLAFFAEEGNSRFPDSNYISSKISSKIKELNKIPEFGFEGKIPDREEMKEETGGLKKQEKVQEHARLNKSSAGQLAVTIVTKVYNSKEYIRECAESVLNQSFKNFEWVVLDNGCTDGTSEILKEYAERDTRVKLFKNEKNSIIYNLPYNQDFQNYVFYAKSEYMCEIDSDDFFHENFLKELYNPAKKFDADIALGGTEMFLEDNPNNRGIRLPPNFYTSSIEKVGDIFPKIYGCFRPIWGKLVRTSIYNEAWKCYINCEQKMKNGSDTIINFHFLEGAKSVISVNKVLHFYRVRKGSHYHSQLYKGRHLDYLKIYERSKKLLESWNKLNEINLKFIGNVLYCSMKDCIDLACRAVSASAEDRIEVITAILCDKNVRRIVNEAGLLAKLLNDAANAINFIITAQKEIVNR